MRNLKNKILYRKVFNILAPTLTKMRRQRNRERLLNHDFTILSSNCMGGIISHEVSEKFLSPFVNLQMASDEFCRFLLHMDDYLSQDLVFLQGDYDHLTALLGDLTLIFTHYKTEEEARSKWEERKKRIRLDNLYVILNDCDGLDYPMIQSLRNLPCKNMVIFTAHKYEDCPHTFYMPQFEGMDHVGNILYHLPVTGAWYFEKYFDFVGWLNSDQIPCENFRK